LAAAPRGCRRGGGGAFGVPVVLIEKGLMGGECLNTACVPSKAMIAAGKRRDIFIGGPFGIKPVKPAVEFAEVNDHIHRVIKAITPNDSRAFTGLGVRVIGGEARFRDPTTRGGQTNRIRDQGPPLRDRDRLAAGGAVDFRSRSVALFHQ
jgi:pyruvate/2-oxoglutarate dehydrogenase complex dihydrolipoamide dehydrogenase (E3) component